MTSVAKPVKGSLTYVWFTGERLGRGAMGNVYLARHRKKGSKCAAKVYNSELRSSQQSYIKRELELLRIIPKHDHIVRLLAVEEETHSNERVVFMELCQGGSLQNILDQAEHFYGLQEEEFMLVFLHIFTALDFLKSTDIVHRDVKPGNILLSINTDGRRLYKLTDFGAAIKLSSSSKGFKSLCGTEEYLHPDMHYSAFQKRQVDEYFGHAVDVWSFGITLYQCATGKLPFRPKRGIRSDRNKMYELMTKKQSGVISQVEKEDGTIESKSSLAETCQLTSGTAQVVTTLLARVFDLEERLRASKFFSDYRGFFHKAKLHVFSLDCREILTLYIFKDCKLAVLKDELAKLTSIPAQSQILFHRGREVDTLVSKSQPVCERLTTTPDQPLLLLSLSEPGPVREFSISLPVRPATSDGDLSRDARWGREVCGAVLYLLSQVCLCLRLQTALRDAREALYYVIEDKYRQLADDVNRLERNEAVAKRQWPMVQNMASDGRENLELSASVKSLDDKFQSISLTDITDSLSRIRTDLTRHREVVKMNTCPACQEKRCKESMQVRAKEATAMYQMLLADKTKTLSHNEQELHKYSRSELKHQHSGAAKLITDHCQKTTITWFQTFQNDISQMAHTLGQLRKVDQVLNYRETDLTSCSNQLTKVLETLSLAPPKLIESPTPHSYKTPHSYQHVPGTSGMGSSIYSDFLDSREGSSNPWTYQQQGTRELTFRQPNSSAISDQATGQQPSQRDFPTMSSESDRPTMSLSLRSYDPGSVSGPVGHRAEAVDPDQSTVPYRPLESRTSSTELVSRGATSTELISRGATSTELISRGASNSRDHVVDRWRNLLVMVKNLRSDAATMTSQSKDVLSALEETYNQS